MFGFVWGEGLYDIGKEGRSVETVSLGETKKKVGWEQLLKSKGNIIESIQIVMMVQACHPRIWEVEAGETQICMQPGLCIKF